MTKTSPKRIVLTCLGSFGDLHPYLSIALRLKARGHAAVIATSEMYRKKVESEGLEFRPIRPDLAKYENDREIFERSIHPRTGIKYFLKNVILSGLNETYMDLESAAVGADLLISHSLVFSGPLVAQTKGIPWVSTVLQPAAFLSKYDPPRLAAAPGLALFRPLGSLFYGPFFKLVKFSLRDLCRPIIELRAKLALPPSSGDALFKDQYSPDLTLALFSPHLGAPQQDWPVHTRVTGFPFYDHLAGSIGLSTELQRFLDAGPAPIVFTLGTTQVLAAGDFYGTSAEAARVLGMRAVLLTGRDPRNRPTHLPDGVEAFEYAPYSALFPRAAINVHQGGVGTTGQALRVGRPMLVVTYTNDQPDNAARAEKLGVAKSIPMRKYTVQRAAARLNALMSDKRFAARATEIGALIQAEDGAGIACDAVEEVLNTYCNTRH